MPNRQKGRKTPDFEMNGLLWEIKSPKGKGSRTIENTLRQAVKQSPYVVIDLRRMDGRMPTKRFLDIVERQFGQNRSPRHAIVITRQEIGAGQPAFFLYGGNAILYMALLCKGACKR